MEYSKTRFTDIMKGEFTDEEFWEEVDCERRVVYGKKLLPWGFRVLNHARPHPLFTFNWGWVGFWISKDRYKLVMSYRSINHDIPRCIGRFFSKYLRYTKEGSKFRRVNKFGGEK